MKEIWMIETKWGGVYVPCQFYENEEEARKECADWADDCPGDEPRVVRYFREGKN